MVSESELVNRLQEILRNSDLDEATPASIRRQLQEDFGIDLTDRKAFITAQIDIFLRSQQREDEDEGKGEEENVESGTEEEQFDEKEKQGDEEAEEDESEANGASRKGRKRRGGGFQKPCCLSPQLQSFVGVPQLPRTEVVKKIWAYIRENNLQDPKNRRNILCDKSLRAIFHMNCINMFQMNKALSSHIWPLSEVNGEASNPKYEEIASEEEREDKEEDAGLRNEQIEEDEENDFEGKKDEASNKQGMIKKKSAVAASGDNKKGDEGFIKLCSLSTELQAFTGTSEMARTEVVRLLWSYIRKNNLQDPKDKQTIICDESLRGLFNVDSIDKFQMNQALSNHIRPLEEEGNASNPYEDENESEEGREEKEVGAGQGKWENGEEDGEENDFKGKKDEDRYERRVKKKKPRKADTCNKKRGGGGFTKLCSLSPKLQALTGKSEMARTEVVKMLWSYIRENNLQDPKNRRKIICDESLRGLFNVDLIDMFQMNKVLSKHIWPLELEGDVSNQKEEENESEEEREEDMKEVAEQGHEENEEDMENDAEVKKEEECNRKRIKKKKSAKADTGDKKRGGGGFTKLCSLSPKLQAFTGTPEMARTEVVRMLWSYIRENDLQDPKNRRKILCDDSLRGLFNVDSIDMFQMNKALSKHIWPLEEEAARNDPAEKGKRKQIKEEESDEVEGMDKRQKKGNHLPISDALTKFLGTGENLSLADAVKRVWDYIKRNNLQDTMNKETIICDDKLKELFNLDSFDGFEVTKLLTNHFLKTERFTTEPQS